MSLRIGLSGRTLEPALCPTLDGIGIYTAALLQHLPSQGLDVQAYTWPAHSLQHSQPLRGHYGPLLAATLLNAGPRLQAPVDLFHFTDHRVVRSAIPCVATVHDAIPLHHPEWMPGRMRTLKNHILRRTIATADWFVAVSHSAVAELTEYYQLPPDRITVVPNGIDDAWLAPAPPDAAARRHQLQIPEAPYFLFVGTFQPRKNVDRLLDAYAMLPDGIRKERPLVLVGQIGWGSAATVDRIRTMQQSGESVFWIRGLRDRETLRAIYAGAGALVFASLYEGFGIPVLEAFASNTPVITSNSSSLPEVAGDAALLVDPQDTAAIAAAMQQLSDDTVLANGLRARGLRRVQQYRWAETATGMTKVYRQLIA